MPGFGQKDLEDAELEISIPQSSPTTPSTHAGSSRSSASSLSVSLPCSDTFDDGTLIDRILNADSVDESELVLTDVLGELGTVIDQPTSETTAAPSSKELLLEAVGQFKFEIRELMCWMLCPLRAFGSLMALWG
eukprot:3578869-Alexandrium_andersonii.AAC.1